jgi:hypothetical protein
MVVALGFDAAALLSKWMAQLGSNSGKSFEAAALLSKWMAAW